jgi:hypothetical protein
VVDPRATYPVVLWASEATVPLFKNHTSGEWRERERERKREREKETPGVYVYIVHGVRRWRAGG